MSVTPEFILWPSNRTIWDRVIYPLDLERYIQQYRDYLLPRAVVYDMEFLSSFCYQDRLFMDGFHLTLEGKSMIIDAVFGGQQVDWCRASTPEQYSGD